MKIMLWPSHYLPHIGGLEVQVHALAKEFQRLGHIVTVVTNDQTLRVDQSKRDCFDGITVFRFPFTTALYRQNLLAIQQILKQVHQIFLDFSPDIVNIHGLIQGLCFYQLRILKNTYPICVSIHGFFEVEQAKTKECIQLCECAKAINTPSQNFLTSLPLNHTQTRCIYNGLPPSKTPLTPLSKKPILLVAARLTKEKCIDTVFYACRQLIQKYPSLKLLVLGDGPHYLFLKQLREQLKLEPVIDMLGFVPHSDVHLFMDQAKIVLIPSAYESFSLIALEAALRARPVIGSHVCGLKEVIQHMKTGILIQPNDSTVLAKAVDLLFRSPKKSALLGHQAHKRALQLFTIQKTTQRYLNMYQQAMEETNV